MRYMLSNQFSFDFSFWITEQYFSMSSFFLFLGILIFTLFPLFFFLNQLNTYFEKLWKIFEKSIYDPTVDPFFDDTSSEKGFAQVVENVTTTFDEIAGNEEAKEELKEIIKFLKNPEAFSKVGAGAPKGVLLAGPPGTGKTLFARAIAGESQRPFIRVSGSQFVELLVGVGAARVRDLFEKAREEKPCLVFIDEIDSIARARSTGPTTGGGNDEREQTLNQLLTEMDGFNSNTGVVVIGATNRIDILDAALLRPGRFDRQITITLPTKKDREAILKVHAQNKKLDESVSFSEIAQETAGFSGADLANLLNEAALLSVRRKKTTIGMSEIRKTIDRLLLGLQKKASARMRTRQVIAFHEVGHALMATLLNPTQPIQKLTILPRGNVQGVTNLQPSNVQYPTKETFLSQILIALSGRAAEELINGTGESTTNAEQDIEQGTRALRGVVSRYAMARLQEFKQESQKRNLLLLGSDGKGEISNFIDNFSTQFIDLAYQQIFTFFLLLRPLIERIADELLASEELDGITFQVLVGEFLTKVGNPQNNFLNDAQHSVFFDVLFPIFEKSSVETEEEVEKILAKTNDVIKDLQKKV